VCVCVCGKNMVLPALEDDRKEGTKGSAGPNAHQLFLG
jgi:hypothetical protein